MEYSEIVYKKQDGKRGVSKLAIICIVVTLLAVAIAGVLFVQNQNLRDKKNTSASQKSEEATNEEIIRKVSAIFNAPYETPSVAKVADKDKLKGQAFFDNAQQGDYLLIYPKAKTALIYRPSTDKVINIGPIATEQQ